MNGSNGLRIENSTLAKASRNLGLELSNPASELGVTLGSPTNEFDSPLGSPTTEIGSHKAEPAPAVQSEEERLREAYKNMPFDEKDNDEWILVALVMDNLLGWIFFVLLIITSSMVLVIIPSAQIVRHV